MLFSVDKCMCHSKTSLCCSVTSCFCLWVPNFFILWCVFTLVVFLNVISFLCCHDVITHDTQHCTTRFSSRIIQTPLLFGQLALGTDFFCNHTCHPALYNWNTMDGKDMKFPSQQIILYWSGDSYNQWIDLNQRIIYYWGGFTVFFVTVLQVIYITLSHKL